MKLSSDIIRIDGSQGEGGGRFITGAPSLHTHTNIEVIEQVTGAKFRRVEISNGQWEISLSEIPHNVAL